MAPIKYNIGDNVLCRVKAKRRICFDEPYSQNHYLESRPFQIIAIQKDGTYIILVEDSSLARWVIEPQHINDFGIDSKFEGKFGYNIFPQAIGGLAPILTKCNNCKNYTNELIERLSI